MKNYVFSNSGLDLDMDVSIFEQNFNLDIIINNYISCLKTILNSVSIKIHNEQDLRAISSSPQAKEIGTYYYRLNKTV